MSLVDSQREFGAHFTVKSLWLPLLKLHMTKQSAYGFSIKVNANTNLLTKSKIYYKNTLTL